MNPTRTKVCRTTAQIARLVVLVAGLACFLGIPWDTPLVAGRVGCLVLGVRVWVVGLALLTTAAVWVPYESVKPGTTQPDEPGNMGPSPAQSVVSEVWGDIEDCSATRRNSSQTWEVGGQFEGLRSKRRQGLGGSLVRGP